MTLHFLKWDFVKNRFAWILLLGLTLAVAPMAAKEPTLLQILFMGYFFFAILQIAPVIGTRMRSQHTLSRNYLLTLPIRRYDTFVILLIRLMVFTIPFMVLFWPVPLFFSVKELGAGAVFTWRVQWFTSVLLVPAILTFMIGLVEMQLLWERTSLITSRSQRALRGMGAFLMSMVELWSLMFCLAMSAIGTPASSLPAAVAVLLIAGFRFCSTRRKWVQT